MAKYFMISDNLYDITQKYSETLPFFLANGFSNLGDENMRVLFGKVISLENALLSKNLSIELFVEQLEDIIEQKDISYTSGLTESKSKKGGDISIQGVLPCPIRVPLVEKFSGWLLENQGKLPCTSDYDLKPASMGVSWIKEDILANSLNEEERLADLFMSAVFELFFDGKFMKKYREQGVFANTTGISKLNKNFDNEEIDLKDPAGHYAVIGVVPAVFMVNEKELGERKAPQSWQDILKPEFEKSLSLPLQDLDMFDTILLNMQKNYGEEGVRQLGRALYGSMHPAEMLKSHTKRGIERKPAVMIMPYFFAMTAPPGGPYKLIWPADGAIISPIYLLSKKSSAHKTQPFVDFLFSKEVGEVFAKQGLFPSTHPEVDNGLGERYKFMWLGWDYINKNDIGALIKKSKELFYNV